MTDNSLFDVFLSHNSADEPAVRYIARRLQQKDFGLRPFLDVWHLVPGQAWIDALADAIQQSATTAVFIGPSGISPWHHEEMRAALNRAVESHDDFRVIPVLLPGAEPERLPEFLRMRTWVDFRPGLEDEEAIRRLVAGIRGEAYSGVEYSLPDEPAPYRGLLRFEPEHARFFHGRADESQRLIAKLEANGFVAVVGNSGFGKSSLVRAGLLSGLQSAPPDIQRWVTRVVTPGSDPLRALAEQLAALVSHDKRVSVVDDLHARMLTRTDGLRTAATTILLDDRQTLLLVIDQFEDLFAPAARGRSSVPVGEAEAFVTNVVDAVERGSGRIRVAIALRADYLHTCLTFPDLRRLLESGQLLLGPLSDAALRQAIVQPAQDVGAFLEKGLVAAILRDVEDQAAVLPLLQQALYELWLARSGPWLTLNSYEISGGVRGAIGRRAQNTYDGLSDHQKEIARRIFLRLTVLSDDEDQGRARAVRRVVARDELRFADAQPEQVEEVLAVLSGPRARLLVTGERTVEIAHEALLRHWPTLRAWLQSDLDAYRVHRHLTRRALEWQALNRDRGALYRGTRLEEAEQWSRRRAADVNALEREFIDASVTECERERAERLQAESAGRFRLLSATLALLAIVIAGLAVVAVQSRELAERRRREIDALRLTLLSKLHQGEANVSTLLAVESLSIASRDGAPFIATPQIRLLEQLSVVQPSAQPLATGETMTDIDVSPDGRWMAAGTHDRVKVWALDRLNDAPREFSTREQVRAVRFEPRGRWLAACTVGGELRFWDLRVPNAPSLLLLDRARAARALAFSGDGNVVAASSQDGTVRIWPLTRIDDEPRLLNLGEGVTTIALSHDGGRLAVGNADRDSVSMWDVAKGAAVWDLQLGEDAGISKIQFSRNNSVLAVGFGLAVRLFNALNGQFLAQPRDAAGVFAFTPDGEWLVAASRDDAFRLIEVRAPGQEPSTLRHSSRDVTGLAISPDSRWLTASTREGALVWSIDPPRLIAAACSTVGRNLDLRNWNRFFLSEPCRAICPGLPGACTPPPEKVPRPRFRRKAN